MILLPPDMRYALRASAILSALAAREDRTHDPAPLVKFFNPVGSGTWLVSELDADGDTLFGLADLGFGCPEMGSFSLREIGSVRLPFGLGIERDLGFSTPHRLSIWADTARRAGSLLSAEQILRRVQPDGRADLPPPSLPDRGG